MPFFGIPIRNGLPIGLGSVAGFGVAPEFSPADLFLGGVNGAWYDPSDSTTLFSDTAGTTPVAQPGAGAQVVVGLMLDKSQNGVGTNGAKRVNLLNYTEQFDNAVWTKFADTVAANVLANPLTGAINADSLTEQALTQVHGVQQPAVTVTAATSYTVSIYVRQNGRSVIQICFDGGHVSGNPRANYDIANGVLGSVDAGITASITSAGNDWYRCVATVTTATTSLQPVFLMVTSTTAARAQSYLGDITKGIYIWGADLRLASEASTAPTYQPITSSWYATEAGNHAISYNSTTARPELSARVNLLTYSEQFDNAAWTKVNATIANDTVVAPDGTLSADNVVEATGTVVPNVNVNVSVTSGIAYTLSVYAKAAGRSSFQFYWTAGNPTGTPFVNFDLSLGTATVGGTGATATISAVGNGWYRCTATYTASSTASQATVILVTNSPSAARAASYTGNGIDGIYLWGAQLTAVNQFPANTYQRIADQYTYDNSASFPRYLRFDGVDDGMSTPANLNLSSTDKATVFAGVRKIVDSAASAQMISELSTGATNRRFTVAQSTTAELYAFGSGGDTLQGATTNASVYAAPVSNVLTGVGDIGGDIARLRLNGSTITTNTGDQGTGNYPSASLFIGSRNNSTFWFNGYLYSLIVRGAATDASTISATETWVANETGISIFDNGPSISLDFTAQTYQVWEV